MPRRYLAACPRSPDFPRSCTTCCSIATVQPATKSRSPNNNRRRLILPIQNDGRLTLPVTVECTWISQSRSRIRRGDTMFTPPITRLPLAPVTTILTPAERVRVDAAGEGLYTALHRDNVDDVIRDLKERR